MKRCLLTTLGLLVAVATAQQAHGISIGGYTIRPATPSEIYGAVSDYVDDFGNVTPRENRPRRPVVSSAPRPRTQRPRTQHYDLGHLVHRLARELRAPASPIPESRRRTALCSGRQSRRRTALSTDRRLQRRTRWSIDRL